MCSAALCFFFFSSRRRHTRFDCDWSSDVCSSDLPVRPSVTLCASTWHASTSSRRGRRCVGRFSRGAPRGRSPPRGSRRSRGFGGGGGRNCSFLTPAPPRPLSPALYFFPPRGRGAFWRALAPPAQKLVPVP